MKLILLPALLLTLTSIAHADHRDRMVEVTVTNASATQIMSPPVVLVHRQKMNLFQVGQPASPGIRGIAEDANPEPLFDMVGAGDNVVARGMGDGVILPGQTATIQILIPRGARYISWVAMYVSTNDGFVGQADVRLRRRVQSGTSPVYDAGTEENNELCAFIPGPPCGNGGVHAEDGAEGVITIHRGVHGVGDLDPHLTDWRNPGAYARISRR